MLQELILLYRLLFGQDKAARHLFRKLVPVEGILEERRDSHLMALCARKRCPATTRFPEREIYDLARDFPILRRRLAVLSLHLAQKKPHTWRELWQDKRDSAGWLTFWAVVIIGVSGIVLGFPQVVLQIIQIIRQ